MKKQICAAAVASLISMPTMADFLGVYAGIDYRTTTNTYLGSELEDTNNLSGYIAFEHFIPILPNAKLKYSDLSTDTTNSSTIENSAGNAILYYELFDNGLFEVDFGLAYTRLTMDSRNADLRGDLGQAYLAAKVHIPATGIHAFAEVIAGSVVDDNATDAELGLAYTFNPDSVILNFSVRTGYRYQEMEINNLTLENKGLFAGLQAHF